MINIICKGAFYFFVYGFMGWVLEEICAAFRYGRFVNKGFLTGPICPMYGCFMILITVDLRDLTQHPFYQFILAVVIYGICAYMAGVVVNLVSGRKIWDYSKEKFNLNGYITLYRTIIGGALAVSCVWLINPFLEIAYELTHPTAMLIVMIILSVITIVDLFFTVAVSLKWNLSGNVYENVIEMYEKTKKTLGEKVFLSIERRMYKAFPEFENQEKNETVGFGKAKKDRTFAKGLCFDKLAWIFIISGIGGDLIETVFMFVTTHDITSRSSVIYGPISIVWGLAGVIGTAILYSLKEKNDRYIFFGGTIIGGVYEYSCSVFTEVFLGTKFWDYSGIPFNINGRINLLYCFFWGIAAIFWIKLIYPKMSKFIEKIPPVEGKIVTYILVAFLVLDMAISGMAIIRYVGRNTDDAGTSDNVFVQFLDKTYTDDFMNEVYPYMRITKK